jgi:predicted dehydrogenase
VTAPENPLRAGIIGLGVGEQHIAGYRAHPDAEVVAVCDIDPAKLELAAERYPDVRRTADARELIEADDVDVVSVASYDDAHHEQVKLALERGKHVFCEKPLCQFEEHAAEIASMLRERPEQRLSSNVPLRMSPRFLAVRERIAQLGEIFHMEGDYDYGRRWKLTDGWRGRIPDYSVVLGGAIHLVDLLLWMTGKEPAEVLSATGNRIATRDSAFKHLDFVTSVIRNADGSTMKVNANLGCVSPHFHGVRLYGTEGSFVNGLPDGAFHWPDRTEPVTAAYPGMHKGDLLRSFVDACLGRGEAAVTERDVFAALSVCFAIERSLAEERPVDIEFLL